MTDPYPPLTPLGDYPLHAGCATDEPYIFACQRPEAPRDNLTAYDWRCYGCVLAAEAHIRIQGDEVMWWRLTYNSEQTLVHLSWMVARSRYWFEETT